MKTVYFLIKNIMTKAMRYWSISSIELCSEARELWLVVDIVRKDKNLFYISSNDKNILFKWTDFWWNTALGFKICQDKWLTYDVLEKHGLPTAKSFYISRTEFEQSQDIDISHLKKPFTIKPLDEGHGNGVMMNIEEDTELIEKLTKSFEIYENMIIQEQAQWDEVRVLVVKWDIILARNRIPAQILWDGTLNIKDLIEKENTEHPLRWEWYLSPLARIKIDEELISHIWKQSLDLNYVPQKWENIQLRGNSNIGTWWTMINVTDIIHPSTKEICIQSAKVLWLEIAWVDILAKDISQKLNSQWGIILEVNATPGIWWEKELLGINSAREILKRVFSL